MDNLQKGAVLALVVVAVVISIYVINTVNSESARVEAKQQAREDFETMCMIGIIGYRIDLQCMKVD